MNSTKFEAKFSNNDCALLSPFEARNAISFTPVTFYLEIAYSMYLQTILSKIVICHSVSVRYVVEISMFRYSFCQFVQNSIIFKKCTSKSGADCDYNASTCVFCCSCIILSKGISGCVIYENSIQTRYFLISSLRLSPKVTETLVRHKWQLYL